MEIRLDRTAFRTAPPGRRRQVKDKEMEPVTGSTRTMTIRGAEIGGSAREDPLGQAQLCCSHPAQTAPAAARC
jgi:hypothetical protein